MSIYGACLEACGWDDLGDTYIYIIVNKSIYVLLVLGLGGCVGFYLVAMSRGYPLVAVRGVSLW